MEGKSQELDLQVADDDVDDDDDDDEDEDGNESAGDNNFQARGMMMRIRRIRMTTTTA